MRWQHLKVWESCSIREYRIHYKSKGPARRVRTMTEYGEEQRVGG